VPRAKASRCRWQIKNRLRKVAGKTGGNIRIFERTWQNSASMVSDLAINMDPFFSYKFLTATIDAIEFRIAAYTQELLGMDDDEDDRRSDIENDVALLRALLTDLNLKLKLLVELSSTGE
jgi:hypothetical protein